MKYYKTLLSTILVSFSLGGLLILWGYKNDGILRMIFGVLIIRKFNYIRELNQWIKRNNGRYVLFYPTKKKKQLEIEKELLPLLPADILKVYYDGPDLVGDMKRSVIIELIRQHKDIKIHSTCLFKIVDNSIRMENLPELKKHSLT
jgi:hypothetical protein